MNFSFLTLKGAVRELLLKEKGSKFIGFAFPAENETEIKDQLQKVRELYPKATHHCYAFRLGISGETYRANDDGEPSGSAGLPIYNQILAHNLTNILVVVVRFYGGTKLGVSGLIKAYKETAKLTLESGEIISRELESEVEIRFSFNQQNLVFTLLNKYDATIREFVTDDDCRIIAKIKNSVKKNISDQLSEMPNVHFKFLD